VTTKSGTGSLGPGGQPPAQGATLDAVAPAVPRTIYARPSLLSTQPTSYCPGCGHGIIHRLVAEVLEEMDVAGRTILVGSVGCSVFAYDYLRLDAVESPHGRAAAVATGVKRFRPDRVVFTYQGDGDLAAIGTAEIVHAAARGEPFTVIFVNNGIYGMTGGQMAPTTLLGQVTTSSPRGRDAGTAGYPLPVTELLSLLPGVAYAARGSVADPGLVGKAKAMIRRAFDVQLEGHGLAIVEVLSTCPVGWGMTPTEAMQHLATEVMAAYPTGTFVDRAKGIVQAMPAPAGRTAGGPGPATAHGTGSQTASAPATQRAEA
jgi:2-oxoglutarate/2-oxoacid ferredoxin oxidoreductase subunit beta